MRWHCMCRIMLSACKRMSLVHREVNQLGPFIARDPYAGYSKIRGIYGINYYYSHGETLHLRPIRRQCSLLGCDSAPWRVTRRRRICSHMTWTVAG